VPLDTSHSGDYVVPSTIPNGSARAPWRDRTFPRMPSPWPISISNDAGNVILSDTITLRPWAQVVLIWLTGMDRSLRDGAALWNSRRSPG